MLGVWKTGEYTWVRKLAFKNNTEMAELNMDDIKGVDCTSLQGKVNKKDTTGYLSGE